MTNLFPFRPGFRIPLPPQPRVSAPGERGLFPHRGRRAAPRGLRPPRLLQGCEQLPPASPALAHVTTFPEHTPEGVPGARNSRSPARSCSETHSAAPRIRADAGPRAKSPHSPTNFASCPPATAWGSKPRGCHRHATRGGDLASVPTPG